MNKKTGSSKERTDVAKLLEIRSILSEMETSGYLNIVYDLIRKIKKRISHFLESSNKERRARPPLN